MQEWEGESLTAFAYAEALLAAVSFARAWQRNLFHSNVKREWNFEHRCHLQSTTPELSASRNTRPHGHSGSQALPYNKEVGRDNAVLGQCAQFGKHLIPPSNTGVWISNGECSRALMPARTAGLALPILGWER